ncbi:hypothetical protein COTS27_00040 [Spirochaetota bacterium]|nr:hypothetical protein COTS27_00040 [Spirochaetota bacterium]
MNVLKRLYRHYLEKWEVRPSELGWICLIFAMTGIITVFIRSQITFYVWGDTRGWVYYVTMPIVFMTCYYVILLVLGWGMGYNRVFIPMVKRPVMLGKKLWFYMKTWRHMSNKR